MKSSDQISQKQGTIMILMFIIGSSSLMVMGLEAKMDIWIAILLAMACGSLIMLVYARLLSVLPGKDLYETLKFFLGNVGSKIFFVFLTWFAFDLCAIVLRNYGQFIVTVGLPETPMFVMMFIMLLACTMAARAGIEVIGRWSSNFIIYLLLFIFVSVLLVSNNMNINHILPVMDNGLGPIARGAFGVLGFPFTETVVFILAFPSFKKGVSVKKVFLKGLVIGGGVIFVTSLTDMLVLGAKIAEGEYYPTYTTMSTVHYGEFLQRFEIIASIVFIIAVFLKLTILLLAASKGITRILGLQDYRFVVMPIAFFVLNFAILEFDNMMYFHEWTAKVFPFYASFFEIVIPVTMLIIIEIKRRKKLKTAEAG